MQGILFQPIPRRSVQAGLARKADKARRHFREYIKIAWSVIDPAEFIHDRYIDCLGDHLQAITEGHIRKLIINIGPGYGKSMISCVLWPSWQWLDHSDMQSIFGSYDKDLALRDSRKCRDLFMSDWYRDLFQPDWEMKKDNNAAGFYTNTANGNRYTFGLRKGGRTGWRGFQVVVDDPVSVDDADDANIKKDTKKRFNGTLSTRINDLKRSSFLLIGHRVANDDLFGEIMRDDPSYEMLILPSIRTLSRPGFKTSISEEWRDKDNELLFQAKFDRPELDYLREKKLGDNGFATQHQQEPSAEDGSRFSAKHFRYYEENAGVYLLHRKYGEDVGFPYQTCWTFASVDVAASKKTWADYTVIMEWAVTRYHDLILLNIHRGRWTEPETIDLMVDLQAKSGYNNRRPHVGVIVEDNGVGLPTLQGMQSRGLPAYGVHVSEDKIAMSATAAIRIQVGSIFFPLTGTKEMDARYPWMKYFHEELIYFPNYSNDDEITALSLAAQGVFEVGIGGLGGAARVEVTDRRSAADVIQRRASTHEEEKKEDGSQVYPVSGMKPGQSNGNGHGRTMYGSRRS